MQLSGSHSQALKKLALLVSWAESQEELVLALRLLDWEQVPSWGSVQALEQPQVGYRAASHQEDRANVL